MTYTYKTHGTCSREIILELDQDIVKSVKIVGGCDGNLKGIASLVQGMKADDVIQKLKGIRCGYKQTSCPDQLTEALVQAKQMQNQA